MVTLSHPSRTTAPHCSGRPHAVLALAAYLPLAFLVTLAAGDLGDVGFWFVWIPVVLVLVYLPLAGIARIVRR